MDGMRPSRTDLYDALYLIGNDASTVSHIPKHVVDFLVTSNISAIGTDGRPHLTAYGVKCYVAFESGAGRVAEFE
jgi:hypothetical protein